MFSLDSRCFQDTVEFREVQLTALARSFTINFDFYQTNIPKLHVPSTQHCSAAMAINTLHQSAACSQSVVGSNLLQQT